MITQKDIARILEGYNKDQLTIGVLGGHSALDVCLGAKKQGFNTLAVCQKGREETYSRHFRTKAHTGIIDETIVLDKFSDITTHAIVKILQEKNTIFIHNRYFWVYFDFAKIQNNFLVPIFGHRNLLEKEERDAKQNQYWILDKAGIKTPKMFDNPEKIDRLCIVKAAEAARGYERAFFFVSTGAEFREKSNELVKKGVVTRAGMNKAVVEEFVLGAQVNFNFFYSPLSERVELMGTDTRRQTNLDGILRLPATAQMEVLKKAAPQYIETGHVAVTVKESLLEKAFKAAESFVKVTQKHFKPGIIGPFALQGAITAGPPEEELVVFDVSMRMPGSPGSSYTPYSSYLWGRDISVGERIAMEIKAAKNEKKLPEVVT